MSSDAFHGGLCGANGILLMWGGCLLMDDLPVIGWVTSVLGAAAVMIGGMMLLHPVGRRRRPPAPRPHLHVYGAWTAWRKEPGDNHYTRCRWCRCEDRDVEYVYTIPQSPSPPR